MRPSTGPWPIKFARPCRRNKLCPPLADVSPGPRNGREFCTLLCPLLAVAVHNELLAFCKSHGHFLPFISATRPLRVLSAERLSFCITLLTVPSPGPASPTRLHAVHLRQSSNVLFSCAPPFAVTGTRSLFWQNGQPLLVLCSPALLVKKYPFILPVGTLSSSLDQNEKLPLPYSMMTLFSNLVADCLEV